MDIMIEKMNIYTFVIANFIKIEIYIKGSEKKTYIIDTKVQKLLEKFASIYYQGKIIQDFFISPKSVNLRYKGDIITYDKLLDIVKIISDKLVVICLLQHFFNLKQEIDMNNSTMKELEKYIIDNGKMIESQPYRKSVLKYRYFHYLDFTDKVLDNFFDCGRSCLSKDKYIHSSHNTFINLNTSSRELIYVNKSIDDGLKSIILLIDNCFQSLKKIIKDEIVLIEYKYRIIATYCEEYGKRNATDEEFEIFYKKTIKKKTNNLFNLSEFTISVCRHKSLMFKYLCDIFNLKCALIRGNMAGGGHVWNIIEVPKTSKVNILYIVDVRNDSDTLMTEKEMSDKKRGYQRYEMIGKTDKEHIGISVIMRK